MNARALFFCLGTFTACALAPQAGAQTLQYNSANPGWMASNGWTPEPFGSPVYGSWSNGSTAQFAAGGSNLTLSVGGSVSVAGLVNTGSGRITLSNGSTTDAINFSGGTINGNFTFGARMSVLGAFEVTGGTVNMSSGGAFSAIQSATVSGGTLNIQQTARVNANSDFHVNGGDLIVQFNTSSTVQVMGDMTVDAGTFYLGRPNDNEFTSASITSLQGEGGVLSTRSNGTAVTNHLVIAQDADTEFSGTITGADSAARLMLTKNGSGNLVLSGAINSLERTTTVDGGALLINGNATSFGDTAVDESDAILVNDGGALGGTGTISTLAGDNVTVAEGGRLIAGLDGTAGRTTYALGSEATLDLSGINTATGWIAFDLGASGVAGTSYDQILLSGGALAIGEGLMNFDDFAFNLLDGFGVGSYTLFDTVGIAGTLGGSLTGTLGGYEAILSKDGNDIRLTVVPEPGVVWSIVVGFGILTAFRRSRRSHR